MSTQPLRAYFDTERSAEDYLFLLINPLVGCHEGNALSGTVLEQTLDPHALTIVARSDLAHAPQMCPRLVTLADPGHPINENLLQASQAYAAEASPGSKRYVCGWFLSTSSASSVSCHLAKSSFAIHGTPSRVWPMLEPLRMELLAVSLGASVAQWLGPIRQSVMPSSSGGLFRLRGVRGAQPPDPSIEILAAQQDAPAVAAVLAAWQRLNGSGSRRAMQRATAGAWTGQRLPAGAAASALEHLRAARRLGLPFGEDRLVFALHSLTTHPRWHEHPLLKAAVTQTVVHKIPLADVLLRINDWTWQRALQQLASEHHH